MMLRSEIKDHAKTLMHAAPYWPMVGTGLVLAWATGLGSSSTSSGSNIYSGADPESGLTFGSEFSFNAAASAGAFAIVVLSILFILFIIRPLEYGGRSWFSHLETGDQKGKLTSGFQRDHYMKVVNTLFLRDLYIFLWSLLLIIPGIIKMYEYYFVPYLIEDHPELSSKEILALSSRMTAGRKSELFVFDLSFILWQIVNTLTAGLAGIFYIYPYIFTSQSVLYHDYVNNGLDPYAPHPVDEQENIL